MAGKASEISGLNNRWPVKVKKQNVLNGGNKLITPKQFTYSAITLKFLKAIL